MFFPDGNFELDLVETSLSIEVLQETTIHILRKTDTQSSGTLTANVTHLENRICFQNSKWSANITKLMMIEETTPLLLYDQWCVHDNTEKKQKKTGNDKSSALTGKLEISS